MWLVLVLSMCTDRAVENMTGQAKRSIPINLYLCKWQNMHVFVLFIVNEFTISLFK